MCPQKTKNCHSLAVRSVVLPAWVAGVLCFAFFVALPSGGSRADSPQEPTNAQPQASPQQELSDVSRRKGGFPVPRKGPLVSELRENLNPDISGPETVIRRYEDSVGNTVREYFINGALFQIEVIPTNGPPYYLIDINGNGLFEERRQGYQPRLVVPQWVLFRY